MVITSEKTKKGAKYTTKISELLDHIWPGDTFRLHEVTIIGPYPTAEFFEELGCHKPKIVHLFADDGVPDASLQLIKKKFLNCPGCKLLLRRVSAPKSSGLVHAKLYMFEWKNKGRTQTKRCLVLGSANASSQGFGLHAETYLSIRISAGKEFSHIRRYFNQLMEHNSSSKSYDVKEFHLELPDIGNVWLPGIRVAENNECIDSFDSWLRRGFLCHKYERDQSFGKLVLSLKQPLPRGVTEKVFTDAGFGRESTSQRLMWPYLKALELNKENSGAPQWHGRYFVWTQYGYWCSEDCYSNLRKTDLLQLLKNSTAILDR